MKFVNLELQYRKFPEMKREEVLKLMEWIKAQPHLQEMPEHTALFFFYSCEYSMELAKRTVDINRSCRTHCPEFFANLDIDRPELKRAMKTVGVAPLEHRTPEGYGVICGKLMDYNASNFVFADIMKLYCMVFDLWMMEEGADVGYLIVMDMKGCSLGHLARISILAMKKFLYFLQEAAPIRIIGLHFINIVPFTDKLLALMTPFLKKDLLNLLQLHNNLENFYKIVPKDILPKEYGGQQPEVQKIAQIYYNKLKDNRQVFLDYEAMMRVNEKLRPGKPKSASELFGLDGNFKKLDID